MNKVQNILFPAFKVINQLLFGDIDECWPLKTLPFSPGYKHVANEVDVFPLRDRICYYVLS